MTTFRVRRSVQSLLVVVCSLQLGVALAQTNLLVNEDFLAGTAPWKSACGSSGFAAVASEAVLSTVGNPGFCQVYQHDLLLQPGTQYELRFDARHTTAAPIGQIRVIQHASPYGIVATIASNVATSTTMHGFAFTFVTSSSIGCQGNCRFRFELHAQDVPGEDFVFDNVRLCEGSCEDCSVDADGDGFSSCDDCDDCSPACNTDCSDADGDGFRACIGDDDNDPKRALSGVDLDNDGYYLGIDCHDDPQNDYCDPMGCDPQTDPGCWCFLAAEINPGAEENCFDGLDNDCDMIVDCTEGSSESVLSNGDFENGTVPWLLSCGGSSWSVVDGEAIVSTSGNPGFCQLYQKNLLLEAGAQYELRFDARHTSGANIGKVRVIQHAAPYGVVATIANNVDTTQSMQSFTFPFQTSTTTDCQGNCRFRFELHTYDVNGEDFVIDNVELCEGSCAVASDIDGDGEPDCTDHCPDDGNKSAPGACGCGVADADTDGNGMPDCYDDPVVGSSWPRFVDETDRLELRDGLCLRDTAEKDIVVVDLNSDGWDDVVVVRKSPFYGLQPGEHLLLVNQAGTLTDQTPTHAPGFLSQPTPARDVVADDFDGDGAPDIVVVNTFGVPPTFYRNLGGVGAAWQGLAIENRLPCLVNPITGAIPFLCGGGSGELDSGGARRPELILADYFGGGNLGDVLLRNTWDDPSSPEFTIDTDQLGTQYPHFGTGAQILDVDNDGDEDVVRSLVGSLLEPDGSPGNAGAKIHFNDGGDLVDLQEVPYAEPGQGHLKTYFVTANDLNGDGLADLYHVGDGKDAVFYSNGLDQDGQIIYQTSVLEVNDSPRTRFFGGSTHMADVDGDGDLDVGVAHADVEQQNCPPNSTKGSGMFTLLENLNFTELQDPIPMVCEDDPTTACNCSSPVGENCSSGDTCTTGGCGRIRNYHVPTHDFGFIDVNRDGRLDLFMGLCEGWKVLIQVSDCPVDFDCVDGTVGMSRCSNPDGTLFSCPSGQTIIPHCALAECNDDGASCSATSTCFQSDTQFQNCVFPNGTVLECPLGQTVHNETCTCQGSGFCPVFDSHPICQ